MFMVVSVAHQNDKKHGKGTYKYTNGDFYEGETQNG